MSEEKEIKQSEGTTAKSGEDGDKPESPSFLDRADATAQRMEEAERKASEAISKLNELYARMKLGGETSMVQREEKKEETPQEYAARVLKGELNK